MRPVTIPFLLLTSIHAFGQNNNNFSLLLQIQPELTFHKNDYAFRWTEKKNVATFNIGVNASLQYNLTRKFFADFGLGFISRKLNTKVFLNQSLLPPPYRDFTLVLHVTKSVAFRTLQFPVGVGYDFIKTRKTSFFIKAIYVPNFIMNTKYETNNYPAFKKNIWQGYSLNIGVGADYFPHKRTLFTSSITYSVKNTVAKDDWTFSQDERGIALTHTYLQLNVGVKIGL